MSTLVLLFTGPLQSWGVRSASARSRDSAMHPTRSGTIGLLAACLGLERTVSPDWSEELRIHVRIDSPGLILTDFHTIGGGYRDPADRLRSATGKPREDAVVSRRDYLTDAAFTVAVEGGSEVISRLDAAVRHPVYLPSLGRKSCPPALPMQIGTLEGASLSVLATLPAYGNIPRSSRWEGATVGFDAMSAAASEVNNQVECRLIEDGVPAYEAAGTLNDVPISFDHWRRRYAPRYYGEQLVKVSRAGTGIKALKAMRNHIADLAETGVAP